MFKVFKVFFKEFGPYSLIVGFGFLKKFRIQLLMLWCM